MTIAVLLIAYLSILYLVTMLILRHCLWGQKPESTLSTEIRFVLKEGQTIVGVGDTIQGMDFYIGDYVRDENYYDL